MFCNFGEVCACVCVWIYVIISVNYSHAKCIYYSLWEWYQCSRLRNIFATIPLTGSIEKNTSSCVSSSQRWHFWKHKSNVFFLFFFATMTMEYLFLNFKTKDIPTKRKQPCISQMLLLFVVLMRKLSWGVFRIITEVSQPRLLTVQDNNKLNENGKRSGRKVCSGILMGTNWLCYGSFC